MAEIKWIKIAIDIFDNRKIKAIETMKDSDSILIIWFKLLCLAGQSNSTGIVSLTDTVPYTDKMLSKVLNVKLSELRRAIDTFLTLKMIEIDENFIEIVNWDKYQASNKMEIIKEQTRERVKKYREKNKAIKNKELEICNVTGNANVTQCNAIEVRSKKKEVISNNLSISQETDITLHAKRFYPEWSDRQIALIIKLAEEYGCIQVKDAIEKVASKDGITDSISYIKKILISKDTNVLE